VPTQRQETRTTDGRRGCRLDIVWARDQPTDLARSHRYAQIHM
jgi:hypothetical protein